MNGFVIPLLPPAWESPSKLEHCIGPWDETQIRYKGSMLIDNLVYRLGEVNHTMVTATAHYYFQAFYNYKSLLTEDIGLVGLAVVFLACKVNEFPRKMRDLTRAYQQEIALSYPGLEFMDREQFELRECVTRIEGFLLRLISFNFRHPVEHLIEVLKDMAKPIRVVFGKLMPDAQAEQLHTQLVNTARSFLHDSFRGLCPHKFDPQLLVSGCLLLAFNFKKSEWVAAVPALNMSWTALFPTLPPENDLKGVRAEFITLFRVRKILPEKIVFTLPDQTPREQPTAPQGQHRKRPRGAPSPAASVSPVAPPSYQQSFSRNAGPHPNSSAAPRQAPYPNTSSAPARHNPEAGAHLDASVARQAADPNTSNAHPLRYNPEVAAHPPVSAPRQAPHPNTSNAPPLRHNPEVAAHPHASALRQAPHPNSGNAPPLRQNPEAAARPHAAAPRQAPYPNTSNAPPLRHNPQTTAHPHASAPPHHAGAHPRASHTTRSSQSAVDLRIAHSASSSSRESCHNYHATASGNAASSTDPCGRAVKRLRFDMVAEQTSCENGTAGVGSGGRKSGSTITVGSGGRESRSTITAGSGGRESRSTITAGSGGRESRSTITAGSGGRESGSTITVGSGGRESGSTSTVGSGGRKSGSTITVGSGGRESGSAITVGSDGRDRRSSTGVGSDGPERRSIEVDSDVRESEGMAGDADGRTDAAYGGSFQIEESVPGREGVPYTFGISATPLLQQQQHQQQHEQQHEQLHQQEYQQQYEGVNFHQAGGHYAYDTEPATSAGRSPVYEDAQRAYVHRSVAFE